MAELENYLTVVNQLPTPADVWASTLPSNKLEGEKTEATISRVVIGKDP